MKKIMTSLVAAFLIGSAIAQTNAIGHVQLTYTDPARSNRPIQTEIYYPSAIAGESVPMAAGTFPVIVFGHGFVMTWSAYQNIWEAFVPQGYVVAFPTTESGFSPVHAEFGEDLSFLVGAIQQDGATNTSSLFYSHIGATSALMGHSMGGGSAFLGADGNTNITTLVTFAAANTNPSSIGAAQNITIPSLVIAGQNDCVAPPAQHQVPMYDSLASPCKSYVEILGGGHCYFAESNFNCSFGEGTCSPNPTISRPQQQDAAQDFALMWLDYYLKGNCAAISNFSDSVLNSSRVSGVSLCSSPSPVISVVGNDLQSTSAATYQWLLNSTPIVGANSQMYTPLQNGIYSVVVTYPSLSCSDTSNAISWVMTAIDDAHVANEVRVFPVPANYYVTVEFLGAESSYSVVFITDLTGRIIKQVDLPANSTSITINLDGICSGTYILTTIRADGSAANRTQFQIISEN